MQLNNPNITLGPEGDEFDITDICSSATLTFTRPSVSGQNTFGVRGQRRKVKGLWNGTLALTFHHDYDAEQFTQAVWGWLAGDDPVPFTLRANDAPIGTDNPEWRGFVAITELPVQDGDPESIAAASVTWETDGVPEMVTEGI